MIVHLINNQRTIFIDKQYYVTTLLKIVKDRYLSGIVKKQFGINIDNLETTIVFVGDKKIRELNRTFRKKDYVTDVLSFAYFNDIPNRLNPSYSTYELGDIVISAPQAKRQAVEQGLELKEEISRLLIHGLLHLLGYDHESSQKDAIKMKRIERRLIERHL